MPAHPDEVRDEHGYLIRELHGVKLAEILNYLVQHYGWQELDRLIRINCFANNPTIKSSLNFLRRMPWAREKVEQLYIDTRTDEVLRQRREDAKKAADPDGAGGE
ncbi:VF530 family protein [Hymenobacter sp. 15J16-1T3B]|uniref:VF530 family protein n=1 Tax=Hymenobacter sp. 15J16-1T3B TaxID=2886941 RepID=UPI001D11CF16|nr:VF530 family protein [Hymenobacter sp. 15J16-1T3B]MCC3156968.1 VF530 family protein [Hymenobacter sp. 15J16-1T3B]